MQTSKAKRLGSGYSSIYKTPEWQKEQHDFEIRLGNYARGHEKSHDAVNKGLRQMKNVLWTYYHNQFFSLGKQNFFLQAFTKNDPSMTEQVKEEVGKELTKFIDTALYGSSNDALHEDLCKKMSAFYNASGISSDASNQSINFKNIMQKIVTSNSRKSENLIKHLHLNKKAVDESIKHNSKNIFKAGLFSGLHNLFKGPDVYGKYGMEFKSYDKYDRGLKVKYNTDEKKEPAQDISEKTNDTDSADIKESISPNGFRLTENGSSSTTTKLLNTAKWLGLKGQDLLNFRLAIMGWLLPDGDHSLYEILYSSHASGMRGKEDLTDAASMDETIDPLTKDEIRDNCGADYVNNLYRQVSDTNMPFLHRIIDSYEKVNGKLLPIGIAYYKKNDLKLKDKMPVVTKSELTEGSEIAIDLPDLPGPYKQAVATYKSQAHLLINHAVIFNRFRTIPRIQQYYTFVSKLKYKLYNRLLRKISKIPSLPKALEEYLQANCVPSPKNVLEIYNNLELLLGEYSDYIDTKFNILENYIRNNTPDFEKVLNGDKNNLQTIKLYKEINTLFKNCCNQITKYIINNIGLNIFGWRMSKLLDDTYATANMLQNYLQDTPKFSGHVYSGQKMLASYFRGNIITTSMFTSTSKKKRKAADYYKGAMLVFNLNNTGVDIGDNLDQVLIPPGCKFKVKKVTTTPEKIDEVTVDKDKPTGKPVNYVYLEEVGNNYSNPTKIYPTKFY